MINKLPFDCIQTCCEYLPKNEQREARGISKIFDRAIFFLQRNPFYTMKELSARAVDRMGYKTLDHRSIGVYSKSLKRHTDPVCSALFNSDGTKVISCSQKGICFLWDLQKSSISTNFLSRFSSQLFCLGPDGESILLASLDEAPVLSLFHLDTQRTLLRLSGFTDPITCAAISPDGEKIVWASPRDTLWFYNSTRSISLILTGHEDTIYSIAFSPDGTKMVSTSKDKTLRVWDILKLSSLPLQEQEAQVYPTTSFTLEGHHGAVFSAAFSPDGTKIVSASTDKTLILWDLEKDSHITLQGHENVVYSAAFSPDGTKIISASADKTLILWDLTTQNIIPQKLQKHTGAVYSAAFSPDGTKIISASADQTLILWDLLGPEESLLKVISRQASPNILPTHLRSKKISDLVNYSATFIADQALKNVKFLCGIGRDKWCRDTYIPYCISRMKKMPKVSDLVLEIFVNNLPK